MRAAIAGSLVTFAALVAVQWPPFHWLGTTWARFAAFVGVGLFFIGFFGSWGLRQRSLLAAFMGIVPGVVLVSLTGPLEYLLNQANRLAGFAVFLLVFAAWGFLFFGWRRIYLALHNRTGVN